MAAVVEQLEAAAGWGEPFLGEPMWPDDAASDEGAGAVQYEELDITQKVAADQPDGFGASVVDPESGRLCGENLALRLGELGLPSWLSFSSGRDAPDTMMT